jgi:TetR/AcrR family transcriptional regulator, cholesterol catabolism regulator
MPTTEAPKAKKELIQEAAARLFRDKGYSATSMRDLAEAVSLRASSLYNHFSSKEEILRDICFQNAQRFLQAMDEVEAMDGSATQKVSALLRLHIHTATQDITSVTAFNDEWRHLSEPHLTAFKALRKEYEGRFQRLIEAGIRAGEFQALNPLIALHTLFSSVRWLYDWYKPGRPITAEELEQELSSLLMKGLKG